MPSKKPDLERIPCANGIIEAALGMGMGILLIKWLVGMMWLCWCVLLLAVASQGRMSARAADTTLTHTWTHQHMWFTKTETELKCVCHLLPRGCFHSWCCGSPTRKLASV